jgi:flagellar hook-length control protein FliK
MNPMLTALMAATPSTPVLSTKPAADAGDDGGFAKCLDQALDPKTPDGDEALRASASEAATAAAELPSPPADDLEAAALATDPPSPTENAPAMPDLSAWLPAWTAVIPAAPATTPIAAAAVAEGDVALASTPSANEATALDVGPMPPEAASESFSEPPSAAQAAAANNPAAAAARQQPAGLTAVNRSRSPIAAAVLAAVATGAPRAGVAQAAQGQQSEADKVVRNAADAGAAPLRAPTSEVPQPQITAVAALAAQASREVARGRAVEADALSLAPVGAAGVAGTGPASATVMSARSDALAAGISAHVSPAIDSAAFAPALATQVRWLVQGGVQQAQLTLNPAEMGPVTVQIVVDGREARIAFGADLAATRSAIESSLPMLAAALDDSGLKLTGGGVHDGAAQQRSAWAEHSAATRGLQARDGQDASAATAAAAAPIGAARGLVDLIA